MTLTRENSKNQSSAKHMIWLIAGKFVRSSLMLVSMMIIARYLGPSNFGLLSFAISITFLFTIFPGPGLDSVLTKQLLLDPESCGLYLGSAMAIYLSFSIISFLLLITFGAIIAENISIWILIAVCGLSYFPRSSSIFVSFFDSKLSGCYIMYSEIIQAFIGVFIRLLLIITKAKIIMFAFAWLFDWALIYILQFFFFYRTFPQYRQWKVSFKIIKSLLCQISPLILSGVMIIVYQQIDKIMLKLMIDTETVGHYSLALRLVYAGAIIPVLGVRSLAPKLFKAIRENTQKEYNLIAQQLYDLTTSMAIIIIIILLVISPLIPYMCGESFTPSVLIIIIASPLILGTTMGASSGQQMLAENLQKWAPIRNAIGCCINIILNFALIPHFSGVGAAIATVVASITASFFCMALIPKCRHIFKYQLRSILTGFTRSIPFAIKYIK